MSMSVSASRFACLPDDDAADWKGLKQKEKKKEDAKKNENKSKDSSKDKAKKEAKELQNIAFGGGSGKKKNKKKNNQKQNNSKDESANFEEWKERDKVQVEDNFTAEMQEAILQSQLEFEHQKSLEAAQQQLLTSGEGSEEVMASLSKEDRKKVAKMQKKPTTMSLDQFNSSQQPPDNPDAKASAEPQLYRHPRHRDRTGARGSPDKETGAGNNTASAAAKADFFDQLDSATVMALDREQLLESYRNQNLLNLASVPDPSLVMGYQERLAASERQLSEARREAEDLHTKLAEAKLRTKKLTEILLSGEMREKTEVLVQVHKLEKVRDELTETVAATGAQLEQERSLVRMLETEVRRARDKGQESELCNRLLAIIKANKK